MRVILYIAWAGLILSGIVHIMSLVGYNEFLNDWEAFVFFLHGGAILLGLPMILSLQKTATGKNKKDLWKIALENCPNWMRKLIGLCLIYGFLSSIIEWFLSTGGHESRAPFKFFSSGWIIFYSLEIGVIHSYLHRPLDKSEIKSHSRLDRKISKDFINKKDILTLPVITMVLANIIPAIGVLFFKWDAFVIVSLYWIETLIIGFFAILRFIFAPVQRINFKKKLIGVPIFSWFLGWCLSAYGVAIIFLFVIFPNRNKPESEWPIVLPEGDYYKISWPGPFGMFELGVDTIRLLYIILPSIIIIPILFLTVSHVVSFVYDYLIKKRMRSADFKQLAGETVFRILAFHFSIMIGGFLISIFSPNITVLVCLVIFKCFIDVKMYLAQENKAKKILVSGVMIDLKPIKR